MAEVRILLAKGENPDQAEDLLYKALTHKRELDPQESFDDPAMIDVQDVLIKSHGERYQRMLLEIFDVLDEEFQDGNS